MLVLGEDCYVRAVPAPGGGAAIDLNGSGFTQLAGLGENALGVFLVVLTSLLNGIDSGKPDLIPYACCSRKRAPTTRAASDRRLIDRAARRCR